MSSEQSTIAEAVKAQVKWFDPRRGYGFCSLAERVEGLDEAQDAFFGTQEAEAGRARGLRLARGEALLCDLRLPEVVSERDGCKQRRLGEAQAGKSSRRRLEAFELRPGSSATSPGSEDEARHAAALRSLAGKIEGDVATALGALQTFPEATANFSRLVNQAWQEHAAAGRTCLQDFVQGACFKAVEAFARNVLLAPELSRDSEAAGLAARWLTSLESAPWCWSPQQRRALAEFSELAGRVLADDAPPSLVGTCSSKRISTVLAQRTQHFVVVLEGVRNSANQQMIFRTCEALGVQEVWLVPPPAGTKYRAMTSRSRHASRGAEKFLTLRRLGCAADVAACCKEEGREIWVSYCPPSDQRDEPQASSAANSSTLQAVPLVSGSVPATLPKLALVLGTEGEGVSKEMLDLATRAVFLPMYGFVQSLNVAVACGMLLQRLFDLCPSVRGDLDRDVLEKLTAQATTSAPHLAVEEQSDEADEPGLEDL